MLAKSIANELLYRIKINSIERMTTKAQNLLNPCRYKLSDEAKKRLRWMYVLYYECETNVSLAARKIGISREWLSKIKSKFEDSRRDPRSLEPESRAPQNTSCRNRIPKETEDKIVEVRGKYQTWGEKKIVRILKRDYQTKVSSSTVNRYLHIHKLINPKLSEKNKKAWAEKKEREREKQIELKIKYRPPKQIKDLKPGALIEKDMKYVRKINTFRASDNSHSFYSQHTFIDSLTRIRVLELKENGSSENAKVAYLEAKEKFPFAIATTNTDNGSENQKEFEQALGHDKVAHFYSRTGTPTDNPRVERSHLTDEIEFYQQGNIYSTFKEQKQALEKWNHTYNFIRPHQALGYLTPTEFYELWKENPKKAHKIVNRYRAYLKKQRERLANARQMKRKEQIENLMRFIDEKLNQKVEIKTQELSLNECEVCS